MPIASFRRRRIANLDGRGLHLLPTDIAANLSPGNRRRRYAHLLSSASLVSLAFVAGVPEPALAFDECGSLSSSGGVSRATCTSSGNFYNNGITYIAPLNSGLDVTLGQDVKVNIPAGIPEISAVRLSNGGVGQIVSLTDNGAIITNTARPDLTGSRGLVVDANGSIFITSAGKIDTLGLGGDQAILAVVQPNAPADTVASVFYNGPGLSSSGTNSPVIQAENFGPNGSAKIEASGNMSVVVPVAGSTGSGTSGLLAVADGTGLATVLYHSGTIKAQGQFANGISAISVAGSSEVTTDLGTTIIVEASPSQPLKPGINAESLNGTAAGGQTVKESVASTIMMFGNATPDPSIFNWPIGIRALTDSGAPISVSYTGPGITTHGGAGIGVLALSGSGSTAGSSSITVVSSGPITTDGSGALGILADSGNLLNIGDGVPVGPGGPVVVTTSGPITTVGPKSHGIWANSTTGTVQVTATNVSTTGEFSAAINATSRGLATDPGGKVTVTVASGGSVMGGWQPLVTGAGQNPTFGLPSAGVVLSSTGGTATLTNNGSIGALSDRAVLGDPVIINNGTITGFVTLAGVSDYQNNGTFNLRHFADINGDGTRDTLRVAVSDLGGPGSTFENSGTLALPGAPGATILDTTGQYLPHGNVLNGMALSNGPVQGQILGATTFTNSGIINLQANSAVGDVLLISGGHTAGTAGGGTFVANGGSLLLDTVLNNGVPSQSDVLVVDQVALGAAGPTRLSVHGVGAGDLTVGDGILVVEGLTNTATANVPHAFALGGAVAAGPYDYLLFRGGTGPGASDDWFLRSTFQPVPPEDGPNPEPPAPPGTPRYRQEVSVYAAMPVLAELYGLSLIDTLHERMGGDAQLLGPGRQDDLPDGTWGRIIGTWGHRDGDPVGIFGRDGPEFDYGYGAIQLGVDLYRKEYENGQRDNAGLYIAAGRAHADVEHNLLGFKFKGGEDDFDAYSVGGYWTRFGENNWYLDGVVQGTWYDMDMSSRRHLLGLHEGEPNGFGFAASLEGGYPFNLGNNWLLEPQAQLVYQALNIDDFNDGAADVRYSNTDSLAGRLGLRLARDWNIEETSGGAKPRKFTLWGRADVWHEFLGNPTTEFSSATGFIPFTADLGDSWGKVGIGAAYQVTDAATFYGNVNYASTFDGNADAWEGKVGLKIQW